MLTDMNLKLCTLLGPIIITVACGYENGFRVDGETLESTPRAYEYVYVNSDGSPNNSETSYRSYFLTDGIPGDPFEENCQDGRIWEQERSVGTWLLVPFVEDPSRNQEYFYNEFVENEFFLDINRYASDTFERLARIANEYHMDRSDAASWATVQYKEKDDELTVEYTIETIEGVRVDGDYKGLKETLSVLTCHGEND